MKVKANTNPGTFSDEALHMITMIQEDIKQAARQYRIVDLNQE